MKQKLIIGVVLLFFAIAGLFAYFQQKSETGQPFEYTGTIVSVNQKAITLEGGDKKGKTQLTFEYNDSIVLDKAVLTITPEQMKSSKQFEPARTVVKGDAKDLVPTLSIKVFGKGNISEGNVKVERIEYASFEFPK